MLDLANIFVGSIPLTNLYILIDPLPLPSMKYTSLKDIYTDTMCQYSEFMIKSTCVVRQGNCLYLIMFNLALDPIKKAKEANGYKYVKTQQT